MKKEQNKEKTKIVYIIIIPVLVVVCLIELKLLLNNKRELENNKEENNIMEESNYNEENNVIKESNYNEEMTLGDILFNSTDVSYDNSSSGLTSTNVKAAIDELYQIKNSRVPIDSNTFQTNTSKTVYASSKGVCIRKNNKLNCFKRSNFNEERTHIQQVFQGVTCTTNSSYVECGASDFNCGVYNDGHVSCSDASSHVSCGVNNGGTVSCD